MIHTNAHTHIGIREEPHTHTHTETHTHLGIRKEPLAGGGFEKEVLFRNLIYALGPP